MKYAIKRPFAVLLCASGLLSVSSQVLASGFQLWEQDGASIGNYHAGYAAEASDASIAWYNPAGITRFHNQQAVFAGVAIVTDFKYKGNVGLTETSLTPTGIGPVTVNFNSVTAQGGRFNLLPALQYVAPINDRLGFGFSVAIPFGLKTDYGNSTALRYAATLTSITVVDVSPSLGYKISDKTSLGAGLDIQFASAEFNNVAGLVDFNNPTTVLEQADTRSDNTANHTGYGFHFGILYELNACTRLGLSYHSQVVHHFTGKSKFEGVLANTFNNNQAIISRHTKTNIKLPPYTAISIFHKLNPYWAVMATAIYTQWNTIQAFNFQNAAGLAAPLPGEVLPIPSNTLEVNVPKHYRNTMNVSIGANYYPTDSVILRAGIGYDQTPITNNYRDVRLPDNNRYAIALGAHFQAIKTVGFDIGWSHIFAGKSRINPPAQVIGAETITTNGKVTGGADVISGQVVWDML